MKEMLISLNHCVSFIRCVCNRLPRIGNYAWILFADAISDHSQFYLSPTFSWCLASQIVLHIDILLLFGFIVALLCLRKVMVRPGLSLHSQTKRRMRNSLWWRIPHVKIQLIMCFHLFSKRYLLTAAHGPVAPVAWFRVSEGLRTNGSYKCRVLCIVFL